MLDADKKINLGIDAKWFFKGPPSGTTVVKNLIDEMIINNHERFNLFLLINSKYKKQAAEYFPASVGLITMPNMPNLLLNRFFVPFVAIRYNLKAVLLQNFVCTWPKKLFKMAYIHDVLFLDYPQYFTRAELFYFKQMKHLATKANSIVAVSGCERKRLIANNILKEDDINVVYHGLDSGFKPVMNYPEENVYHVINKYDLPVKYILFVGRINIRKNLINLVKALTFIDDADIKLLIVGEKSNLYDDLANHIEHEKLNDRIIFTGHVPEKDLQLIYACATIFCFPSFAEGFGLPPLEAMKCGVPVVVSNRTAMPEICGDAAVYIDPDDPRDIGLKINSLLGDRKLYNNKVKIGLNRAAGFVWSDSAKQILNIIEKADVN